MRVINTAGLIHCMWCDVMVIVSCHIKISIADLIRVGMFYSTEYLGTLIRLHWTLLEMSSCVWLYKGSDVTFRRSWYLVIL